MPAPARSLVAHDGAVLRRERERAERTQGQLAAAAGTSQAVLAHIERGSRAPSLPMLERLFAALGRQVRFTVEPLDVDLDAEMDRLAADPMAARLADSGVPAMVASLRAAGLSHVLEGAAAAAVPGAPVPVDVVDTALLWSEADALTDWLTARWARRWSGRWGDWGYQAVDPRLVGPHEWLVVLEVLQSRLRGRMVDELPASIRVGHDGCDYDVRPLVDVEVTDPHTADLLRRYRSRCAQSPP